MSAVTSIAAQWRNLTDKASENSNAIGDAFSRIFDSAKNRSQSTDIETALARLSERFPNLSVKAGEVGEGVENAKKAYGDSTEDQVTVAPDLLSSLFGNSNLAKTIEDAISGFMNNDNNLMQVNGAYVQRTVTITVTTVRYSEFHRSEENDEVMAAADLRAELNERIREMIEQLFGGGASKTEETDEETTDETKETGKNQSANNSLWGSGAYAASWSLQLYYSSALLSSFAGGQNGQNGQNLSAAQYQQFSFAAAFSGSLSMQNGGILANGSSGSSNAYLANFMSSSFFASGFSADALRLTSDGLFFNLKDSKSLLSQMLDSLRSSQETPDAAVEETPVGTETVEEDAVAPVA